jgi:hypothetical protein
LGPLVSPVSEPSVRSSVARHTNQVFEAPPVGEG